MNAHDKESSARRQTCGATDARTAAETEQSVTHTAGPWRRAMSYQPESGRIEPSQWSPYIVDSSGRNVAAAMMGGFDDDLAVVTANAHLISASPDLLAALKQARREYGVLTSLSGETLVQMDAAIAKAEGTP